MVEVYLVKQWKWDISGKFDQWITKNSNQGEDLYSLYYSNIKKPGLYIFSSRVKPLISLRHSFSLLKWDVECSMIFCMWIDSTTLRKNVDFLYMEWFYHFKKKYCFTNHPFSYLEIWSLSLFHKLVRILKKV